jgi:fatty acid desaturase
MSSISIPSPKNVPTELLALAGLFFAVAVVLVVVVGLISFGGSLLQDSIIIWVLMAIWFVFVVFAVWYDE